MANLMAFLQLLLMGIALFMKLGMQWVAMAQVISVVIVVAIALYEGRKLWPKYEVGSIRHATMATVRDIVKPSLHFLVIQVAQTISLQGIIILAGILFNPVTVVVVASIRTMTNVSQQVLGMIMFSAWPEFTRLDERGDEKKLAILFRLVLLSLVAISGIIAVIYLNFGKEIFGWWLGGRVDYDANMMLVFVILMMITTFWMGYRNLLMAVNQHKRMAWVLAITAILEILLALLGGKLWGPVGMVGGMVIASILLPFWSIPMEAGRKWKGLSSLTGIWGIIALVIAIGISGIIKYGAFIMLAVIFGWWLSRVVHYYGQLVGKEHDI